MADHWWEGRPWEMLCVLTPAFMLFLVHGCRHLGAELAAPADLATWQWAVQGGVPCPTRGREVLAGGAGSGRWRRNGRAMPVGRSRVAPGRGARCFRVPGSWRRFHPVPPPPGLPGRPGPGGTEPSEGPHGTAGGRHRPLWHSPASAPLLLSRLTCAPRERGFVWNVHSGPQPLRRREQSGPALPGRQVWAVTPGPGPLPCRVRGPWPLARGAGWEAGPAGQSSTSACSGHPGLRVHPAHGHSVHSP